MSETWSSTPTGYEPDFVERNGAWLLSILGVIMTCVSGITVYMLKSRCRTIKCCGCECERDVLDLTQTPAEPFELQRPATQRPAVRFLRPPPLSAPVAQPTSSESEADKV